MKRASNPSSGRSAREDDVEAMRRAMSLAGSVRGETAPNPWVGAVLVSRDTPTPEWFEGATAPPGGPHAEVSALRAAGERAAGGTLYTTLEPCFHDGRTPPCVDAVISSGVGRVVVGIVDPDPNVSGRGVKALENAGIQVDVGVLSEEITAQLMPYLKHRQTGRPWVVLKLAASLDGRIAAPDGSSRWITGEEARADSHSLRAESGAVLVGAGTVRSDDPELTVRLDEDEGDTGKTRRQPLRVVLGSAPPEARIQPAVELSGDLETVLAELGGLGVLQLLVEGGAHVAHAFHSRGLVDKYVIYFAPVLFGGDEAVPMFAGPGARTMAEVWRGEVLSVSQLGADLKVELAPRTESERSGRSERKGEAS